MTNGPIKRSFDPSVLAGHMGKTVKKKKKKKKEFKMTPEMEQRIQDEAKRRGWTK